MIRKVTLFMAVALAAGWFLCRSHGEEQVLDEVMQANVEALAAGEGGMYVRCYGTGGLDCPINHVKVYSYTEIIH